MEKIKDNKKIIIILAMVLVAIFVAIMIVKPFSVGGRNGGESGESGDILTERTAVYILNDAPHGTIITEEMIDVKVVADGVDINAFQYKEDVIGKETLKDINGGSAIERSDIEKEIEDIETNNIDTSSGLASRIPEGLRAVLMPTGPVQEIVSYLEEGDRVDLIITHTKGDGHVTSTPFKNLEVLLLGEGISAPPIPVEGEEALQPQFTGGGSDISSVILAVTPEQAELISNMRISGVLETAQISIRSKIKETK